MKREQPKTLLEAIRYFSDDQLAFDFVVSLRWSDGKPVCPRCGCLEQSFISTRRIWKCKGCKRQFSVKVGTIFEDSPIGFDKWLPCIWLIANSKNSISSYEVGRSLGVTQKTAWFMLHRIRAAMATGTFQRLSGTVEIDETYVGGRVSNMHKRSQQRQLSGMGTTGKTAVQGFRQRDGGIVRAQVVKSPDQYQTQMAIRMTVEPGSAIYTDESKLYWRVGHSFAHKTVNHTIEYVSGDVWTNGIENFWAILKRAIKGTQVHVSPTHLDRYVTERTFAYNYRADSDLTRMRAATKGVADRRVTWKELTAKAS